MLTNNLGHLGIQQLPVCHLLSLCFVLLIFVVLFIFKIYEQHRILKLLGCEWDKFYEVLKDFQGENENSACIFNKDEQFL
jgi:hypothetical protein